MAIVAVQTNSEDDPALPPGLGFMQLLWAVDHGLGVTSRRMVRRLGLTGPQRLVIRLLGRFPGTSPGALARMMRLHAGTVSVVLRTLASRRLVARETDPLDARRTLLRLTARGSELDAPHRDTVEAAVSRVLVRIPRRHVAIARHVLRELEAELTR